MRSLRRNSPALEDEPPIPPIAPLGERPGNGQGLVLFLPFLRPLGFWCIRTEGLVLVTEARRSWILRTSPVRSSWSRSALRTCYNCIYYRVNLSRCGRAATCLPTRLGLASHPTNTCRRARTPCRTNGGRKG